MNLPRCAGILLHVTSLPSRFGIGDFGPAAFRFADQLAAGGQTLWQVLPLGPTGNFDSPYQSFSAFAGDPLLISPELLVADGVLTAADLRESLTLPAGAVDYDRIREWKLPLFKRAYENFCRATHAKATHLFEQFCADHNAWLEDFALFVALKDKFGRNENWTSWGNDLVQRNPVVLARYKEELAAEIECQKYWQFVFYRQWDALRHHCASCGVRIMGDIPIYVAHDSADVWVHQQQFLLESSGKPHVISGVPPDYFSQTGQLWGNPIYNWKAMVQSGFEWWIERFRGSFRLYDALRVDHFRGFEAFWEVPAKEETAINGKWVKAPGEKLFHAVSSALGELEIIAENLGVITPEVEALRRKFKYPGMAILQFAFGTEGNSADYRPHNLERQVIAYTGTHDNDTAIGWWNSGGGDSTRSKDDIRKEKEFTLKYLGAGDDPINWKMIRVLQASVAQVVIIPMQDVLGLGSESRMNRPGIAGGNWRWRMLPDGFTEKMQARLLDLATLYERLPVTGKKDEKKGKPTKDVRAG